MRFLALTPQGMEDIACAEIREILSVNPELGMGWIAFDLEEISDAMIFAYRSQSISKLMIMCSKEAQPKDSIEESINSLVNKADLSPFNSKFSFAARAVHFGSEGLSSPEIAGVLGKALKQKTGATVNLGKPDAVFTAFLAPDLIAVGLDLTVEDIAKRSYRIFQQGQAIKAPLAYALVRRSGFNKISSLLDPFCSAGTIPIEAALFSKSVSPNKFCPERLFFYNSKLFKDTDFKSIFEEPMQEPGSKQDKAQLKAEVRSQITAMDESFKSVSASKKNAKIAGVEKLINFSRLDVEWLDVKFGKHGIDCIASFPPLPGRLVPLSKLEKIYKEFVYQCDYILSKKGRIAILAKSVEPWLKPLSEYKFKVSSAKTIFQGKEPLILLVIERE